ncbi:MAG: AraC family transcriptional regulator [Mameliella sp.]|nr:AraC family transcriptional regulator [Phaeodactylibacter sp.]
MKQLPGGSFIGSHYTHLSGPGFTLTDTAYTEAFVDWHRHEHAYYTFLLAGYLQEESRETEHWIETGSILFHTQNDRHRNHKGPKFTRGFHLELEEQWLEAHDLPCFTPKFDSQQLKDPRIQQWFYQLLINAQLTEVPDDLSITALITDIYMATVKESSSFNNKRPDWLDKVRAQLWEYPEATPTLKHLGIIHGVHPAHISRAFNQHLGITLSHYLQLCRTNRAARLLIQHPMESLTAIGQQAGFYDQAHFIKTFKRIFRQTPGTFRRQASQC